MGRVRLLLVLAAIGCQRPPVQMQAAVQAQPPPPPTPTAAQQPQPPPVRLAKFGQVESEGDRATQDLRASEQEIAEAEREAAEAKAAAAAAKDASNARKDIPVPVLRRWCSWGWMTTVHGVQVRTQGSLVDVRRSASPWVECKPETPPVIQQTVMAFIRPAPER